MCPAKGLGDVLPAALRTCRSGILGVYARNRSPAQVGCMRQALGPGALGGPGGSGWGGRWEGGSGWGRRVNPRPFQFNV